MELADSWSVDAHKTLNVPYDCGIVLCREESALVSAMRASGDYLIHGSERDNMNYVPDMSRRARGFELWAALKYLGKSGVETLVNRLHDNTCYFARRLYAAGFLVLNDIHFNQLLVACGSDEATQTVLRAVQEDRVCWCGGTKWRGRAAIRISVCNWSTTPEDIDLCVESFGRAKALADV
jgi:glutamate/tyrosine decarboxylase-like PLP-dependent enzyme